MDYSSTETDTGNTTSLRYEKTQNRDVIGTIERINRSRAFKGDSARLIAEFGKIALDTARSAFREEWRGAHETHENPKGLSLDVMVGSPIYRKDGDSFHYTMSISTTFMVDGEPRDNETREECESRMSLWFSKNIAPGVTRRVSESMRDFTSADPNFAEAFSYPSLIPPKSDEIGKIGREPDLLKVNVLYMTTLKTRKEDSPTGDSAPFMDSEAIREGLSDNMALALERIHCARECGDSAERGEG